MDAELDAVRAKHAAKRAAQAASRAALAPLQALPGAAIAPGRQLVETACRDASDPRIARLAAELAGNGAAVHGVRGGICGWALEISWKAAR